MYRLIRSALSGAVALACACGGSAGSQPLEPSQLQSDLEPISFQEIDGGTVTTSGILERRRLVIEDAATWSAVWADLHATSLPQPEIPLVDFGEAWIVVAAMGQRPTGGYEIAISDVSRDGGKIVIKVLETTPGSTCFTSQALTAPATAIAVHGARGGEVEFIELTESRDC